MGRLSVLGVGLACCLVSCGPPGPPPSVNYTKGQAPAVDRPLDSSQLRGGQTQQEIQAVGARRVFEQEKLSSRTAVVVTSGGLSRPYTVLGQVHADTLGTSNIGSALTDAFLRSPLAADIQATPKATVAQMNERVKRVATEEWGQAVDAVINVTYQTDPNGNLYADGVAVQFVVVPPPSPPELAPSPKGAEERLEALKHLFQKGLISKSEYDAKRAVILQDL
jgi:hypothetical protein